MTFSHFSKGFIRPNLGEESGCGYDKRKCENGNVKGVVSLQTVIVIRTLSPVLCHPYSVICTLYSVLCTLYSVLRTLSPVLCPNRKDFKRL